MVDKLERLRALIAALVRTNRFYGPRLHAAGFADGVESLEQFQAKMPFTRKDELADDQKTHPPYGSNLTFPLETYSRFSQTTGTSGSPLVWLDTTDSWNWMLENWRTIYRAAGVTAADRIFFAFSFGPFLGFWTAFEAASRLGCLCIPGGGQSSAARLHGMIDHEATVLCCTPTYALHLAEVSDQERIDLGDAQIRKIIVAGEPGGSVTAVRARIASAWPKARLFDHYGMTEIGPAAFEEGEGTLRVVDDSYLAEVIDPQTGAPVPPGDLGELVVTTLGRIASPVLRYRTGDLVKYSVHDGAILLEGGIIGRVDDMIVVRGVNIYPSAVDAIVRAIPGVGEYRVEVTRRGALREIGLLAECRDERSTTQLEHALATAFTLRIPVTRMAPGSLPRFQMKAQRWLVHD
jgi:phenylacetate-CoA ligase